MSATASTRRSRIRFCPPSREEPTLYTTKYLYVTRDIPLKRRIALNTVNKETGRTVEEDLLEYCELPRSIVDLKKFLDINNKNDIQARFTKPLLRRGKLKFVYPETPKSNLQRYLKADIEISPEMEGTIHQLSKTERHLELERRTLEFCQVPRTLGEIRSYLGLAGYDTTRRRAVQPLIDQGKIKLMYPHDPFYKMQKYVVSDSELGYAPFTANEIMAYCTTPRSKEEIGNHFAVGQELLYKVLNPLIKQGKLIYTKSTRVGNKIIHRKLITNG